MKFAIFVALCVISQCIVIDAFYVSCRTYDRHVRTVDGDRRNIRNRINSLYSTRSSHYNTIRSLESRVRCLYPEVSCVKAIMRQARDSLNTANSKLSAIRDILNNHEGRLQKLETWDTCVFRKDFMLCLVERFLAKNPNF